MINRINPYEIIIDHYKTFYNNDTKKINVIEISFQFFFPIIISFCISTYVDANKDLISNIIVAFSISSGFLFSLLIPLCDLSSHLKDKLNETQNDPKENYRDVIDKLESSVKLAEELFSNVSFALLLCLTSVVISIILLFIITPVPNPGWVCWIVEWFAYSFYIISLLTLLVIIQRVYKIFKYRLDI